MEQLTVISGNGEHVELSPEKEALQQAAALCRKANHLVPAQLRNEVIRCCRHFFPSRYQEPLEKISEADAFKLASALALLAGKDKAGVFPGEAAPQLREQASFPYSFVSLFGDKYFSSSSDRESAANSFSAAAEESMFTVSDLLFSREDSGPQGKSCEKQLSPFSFTEGKIFQAETLSAGNNSFFPAHEEMVLPVSDVSPLLQGNFTVQCELPGEGGFSAASGKEHFVTGEKRWSEESFSDNGGSCGFTNDVILAAYRFKWPLEYAASLAPELLRRCLEIAGERKSAFISAIPEEIYTPEAVRRAAERAAEAVANYRKNQ